MKSLQKIREQIPDAERTEAYAQYLFRTNKTIDANSWLDFMGASHRGLKIAKPLKLIDGGLQ